MDKERAVVYARVSTDHEEQKSSIKSQKEYYAQYAKEQGYELVNVYFDEGLTGTNPKRKAFLQMMHDAGLDVLAQRHSGILSFDTSDREPLFEWIITKDIARFSRNTDATTIVKRLREKNVYIEFEALGFTTKDIDWEFRFNLFITFVTQESIDKQQKGQKAYQLRSDKGEFHMSRLPLGFKRIPDNNGYEIDEDEAVIVRFIFDQYVNHGIGTTTIADMCNEKGYKTKENRRFTGNSVLRIINNEKYKGLVITKRFTHTDITGTHKRIETPKEQWKYNHDALPKIVSVEMFDKAQEIREKRAIETKNFGRKGKKIPKSEFYMKIYCGKCGADYVRISAKKNRVNVIEPITEYFYSCRNRRNKMRIDNKCDNKGISHNVLVRELTRIGKELNISYSSNMLRDEQQTLNKLLGELDRKLNEAETDKNKIMDQIDVLDEQMGNLTLSIANGASENAQKVIFKQIDKIEIEKAQLESKMLEYDITTIENKKQEYLDKYKKVIEFSKKKEYSYEDVLSILHRIDVLEDRTVIVELKTPTLQEDSIYKDDTDSAILPFTFQAN